MRLLLSFFICLLFGWAHDFGAAAEVTRPGREQVRVNYRANQPSPRLRNAFEGFAKSSAADTLDLLAIRVEFRPDTSDRTTGNGLFLRAADPRYTIDPPPHNRSYFAAQLTALANYYKSVSRGKLILNFQVYPQAEDQAYALAQNMSYYAPGREHPQRDQRLAELLRDGFTAADAQGNIIFSRFDSFILFHAGVGEDFNEEFDPTPNDIASAFLALSDLRKELGNNDPNYKGIAVQNGSFYIEDGIVLPEMQSREIGTQGLVEFGLLGTSALMFGYQLGLPNLFNTGNGASGIGQFGLMDQGSNNYQGLLPAQPSAWEKVFLGWEQPIVLTQGENLEVAAALHENPNKIYKIPITDTEYFLLENRQRDVNGDRIAVGRDVNGVRIEFKEGSFLAGSTIGVIIAVDEYDFGLPHALDENARALPGTGILIWHIDEAVIRAKYASNQVNNDPDRRGVDLEEADGAQDIGKFYGFLSPGSGSELGLPEDAWWKNNPIIKEYLRPDEEVAFGPATIPSTASNDGVHSNLVITNFSEIAPVMTFSVRNQFAVPNFPQFAGGKSNALSPMLDDLNGDGQIDIVVAHAGGEIFAWQFSGQKVIANSDSAAITQPNGTQTKIPAARFAVTDDSLFAPPVLADLNNDGRAEVIAAGRSGKVQTWQARDDNGDGRADLLWEVALGNPVRANLVAARDRSAIYCGAVDGRVTAISNTGMRLWELALGAEVRGMCLNERAELIAGTANGLARVSQSGALLQDAPVAGGVRGAPAVANIQNDEDVFEIIYTAGENVLRIQSPGANQTDFGAAGAIPIDEAAAQFAVGDINRDGRKEIVIAGGNQLRSYNFNGVLTREFPLQISTTVNAKARYELAPIVLDVDGDEMPDVVCAGADGNVYAYRSDGRLLAGFPLAMSGPGLGSLAAADLNNDGVSELIGVSGNGYVNVWRLPESKGAITWPMLFRDALHSSLNTARDTPQTVDATDLMPEKSVYNYPNPTAGSATRIRYFLSNAARVKISIFDTAGDLVAEIDGPGLAAADNEIEWNLQGIQSGVYLAKVQAEGEAGRAVRIIKIAVVK